MTSKKLRAMLAAVALEVVHFGVQAAVALKPRLAELAEPASQSIRAVQLFLVSYIGGQGLADVGKEKAKIERGPTL